MKEVGDGMEMDVMEKKGGEGRRAEEMEEGEKRCKRVGDEWEERVEVGREGRRGEEMKWGGDRWRGGGGKWKKMGE